MFYTFDHKPSDKCNFSKLVIIIIGVFVICIPILCIKIQNNKKISQTLLIILKPMVVHQKTTKSFVYTPKESNTYNDVFALPSTHITYF